MLPINTLYLQFLFTVAQRRQEDDDQKRKWKRLMGDLFYRNRRRVEGQARHAGNPLSIGIGQLLLYHTL